MNVFKSLMNQHFQLFNIKTCNIIDLTHTRICIILFRFEASLIADFPPENTFYAFKAFKRKIYIIHPDESSAENHGNTIVRYFNLTINQASSYPTCLAFAFVYVSSKHESTAICFTHIAIVSAPVSLYHTTLNVV